MPFSEPLNLNYHEIFKPALEDAGYSVTRADDLSMPRPIMDDIRKSIRETELILCEMSGKNANVFYELGLAHAIGKPAILVYQDKDDIPFDLRHIRTIRYDPKEDAWKDTLQERIKKAVREVEISNVKWPLPLTTMNIARNQDEFTQDLLSHIQEQRPRTALLLAYSSSVFGGIIEALINEKVQCKLSILMQQPKADKVLVIKYQEGRICGSVKILAQKLRSYDKARLRFYREPASLRGMKLGDKLIWMGWYTYDIRDKSLGNRQIWGDVNAVVAASLPTAEAQALAATFDKVFGNLWENASTPKEICGICKRKTKCLGENPEPWLELMSQK
jgi:hypothetical protein